MQNINTVESIGNSFASGRRGPFANTDPAKLSRCKRGVILAYNIVTSHLGLLLILILHSFVGAVVFRAIEGTTGRKSDHERMNENRNAAILKLTTELIEAGLVSPENETFVQERIESSFDSHHKWLKDKHMLYLWPSAKEFWDLYGSLFYCATLYTTIGYGTIFPATLLGQWVSIVYAIVGIPIFLITMADMGLLFTKVLQAVLVWGSKKCCKSKRVDDNSVIEKSNRQQPSNGSVGTDFSKITRKASSINLQSTKNGSTANVQEPITPQEQNAVKFINITATAAKHDRLVKNEAFDDVVGYKLNETSDHYIPFYIPLIITILYALLFTGILMIWESWHFSEAFYFVFITFTTIGLGDYVPHHRNYFLASFALTLVGLALVAMVINVIITLTNKVLGKAKVKVHEFAERKMSLQTIEEVKM